MVRIYVDDARRCLKRLPGSSIHAVVTSPPFFALRDYETTPEVWGGDPTHMQHHFNRAGLPHRARWGNVDTLSQKQSSNRGSEAMVRALETAGGRFCECGAWLGNLGMEPSPELYVTHLCEVVDEIWRVLRDDGIFWLNLGDSCAGSGKGRNRDGQHSASMGDKQRTNRGTLSGTLYSDRIGHSCRGSTGSGEVKSGDLYGIPWAVAFALRERGWYLRRDNIWHKPNGMPEPVDGTRWERCRVKVEVGGRKRQGDPGQAGSWFPHSSDIRNPPKQDGHGPRHAGFNERYFTGNGKPVYEACPGCKKCLRNDGWVLRKNAGRSAATHEYVFQLTKRGERYYYDNEAAKEPAVGPPPWGGRPEGKVNDPRAQGRHGASSMLHAKSREEKMQHYNGMRNRRDVWKIPTRPYSGAHFATFPPELVKKCLEVSVSHYGVCSVCGAPWARQVTRLANGMTKTDGWLPSCRCGGEVAEPTVLDPFGGSATVAVVAEKLGADSVIVELNPAYAQLGQERILKACGTWTQVEVEVWNDPSGSNPP